MISAILLLVLCAPATTARASLAPAQSGGTPSAPAQPVQDPARELEIQYQLLSEQYARSETEWSETMRASAGDLARRQELAAKHPVKAYWARFEKLAEAKHGRALLWLATHAENQFADKAEIGAHKKQLFDRLVEGSASEPWALEIVDALARQRVWLETPGVEAQLNAFVARTSNKELAATALLRVAAILSGPASKGEEQKRADDVRARIQKEYPETETARKLRATSAPAPKSIQPGSKAPEFTGKDVDGAELRLSDFQGKVVLLDFWGFWCPHCRAMLAHERELVQKYKDAPFVLLGVTSDEDAAAFRELSKQNSVTWRSIWDGGRNGPLAQLYQVRAFPTLFLIDAQGVIRKSWVGEPNQTSLDEEIEALVAAAKSAKK